MKLKEEHVKLETLALWLQAHNDSEVVMRCLAGLYHCRLRYRPVPGQPGLDYYGSGRTMESAVIESMEAIEPGTSAELFTRGQK